MTAINFPDVPTIGQEFTVDDFTWQWTGTVWTMVAGSEVSAQGSAYIGEVKWFGSALAVPPLFLICNGAAVSRATYSMLFAKIGTQWGPGNGSSTFNLPNLMDRTLRGGPEGGAVGGSADSPVVSHNHGASSDTRDTNHYHSVNINTNVAGNHMHGWSAADFPYVAGASGQPYTMAPNGGMNFARWAQNDNGNHSHNVAGNTSWHSDVWGGSNHAHAITVNAQGESGIGKNWPPYGIVVPAIYAAA